MNANFNIYDRMENFPFGEREAFGMGRCHRGPHGPGMGGPDGFPCFRHGMPPHGMGPHGMPPHGMPPHGMGPHGMGPGCPGMPPRRPDREFLRRRLDEADLAELIDMAGRMLRRRPQGGPAQGQALILAILAGREALSQRQLQQMLGIQPGSLSEVLSKLEGKGLIRREKAEDRRGNLLYITDAGREASAAQGADDDEGDPFSPLTAEQQDQLAALLRALLTRWVEEVDDARRPPRGDKPVQV